MTGRQRIMRAASVQCLSPIPRPSTAAATRFLSSTSLRSQPARIPLDIPPPFPVTKICPEPSCSCPSTPSMPAPIDFDQPLNGTMAAYAQQLLVCTGQPDWTSRIEEDGQDQNWGELVRGLKRLLGRGGKYADVCTASLHITLLQNKPLTPDIAASRSTTSLSPTLPSYPPPRPPQLPLKPPPPSSSPVSNTSPPFPSTFPNPLTSRRTSPLSSAHSSSPANQDMVGKPVKMVWPPSSQMQSTSNIPPSC